MFDKLKNNNDEEVLEALHRFRENRTASTYSTMSGLVHEQLSDLLSLVTPTDTPLVARLARDRAVARYRLARVRSTSRDRANGVEGIEVR